MRFDRRISLAGKLAATHLALSALVAALALGWVYWRVGAVIDAEQRRVVETELRGLGDHYFAGGVEALSDAIATRLEEAGMAEGDAVYLVADWRGRPIVGNLSGWPPSVAPGSGWAQLTVYRTDRAEPTEIAGMSLALEGEARLFVARDKAPRAAFDDSLRRVLIWALAAAAALAALSGWMIRRMVRARLAGIDAAARRIMTGDLQSRAPRSGARDEFDRLAATLNAMLERIAALIADLRMVTDSMAHDLRGPLARALRRLDAARAEPAPEARAALLDEAEAETRRVLAMSASLLDISRIEAGLGREQFAPLDLSELTRELAELYEAAAEERGLRLRIVTSGPARVDGHRQLLAQALSNLIENALRHAPPGGEITLGAEPGAVWVRDRGPGLPEADRSRMLERFARRDPARSGTGVGLGLSLAAAVARLHGGAVVLSDAAPGLLARITLAPQDGPSSK